MSYVIHWFRRDLRLQDNVSISEALRSGLKVKCIFIFDDTILSKLSADDRRVSFLYDRVLSLKKELQSLGSDLQICKGNPLQVWESLSKDADLKAVYTNRDYEPYARERDAKVESLLSMKKIYFNQFKDQVIFEEDEVLTQSQSHYTVFTPYSKRWKNQVTEVMLQVHESDLTKLLNFEQKEFPTLSDLGFERVAYEKFPLHFSGIIPNNYKERRDYPSVEGTTRLSVALRFGLVSIRELILFAIKNDEVFLNELIWREFFMQILWKYPYVTEQAFRKEYDRIEWRNDEDEFRKWCEGKTGYSLVDAGMRELNETGYMHNRVRMITSGFLIKHLLIDWRWGELYFAQKLMDFDLSANNGNWQWAAGCGTDAAPYFRIFNPITQQKKFDKEEKYIKKWIPEWGTEHYPKPIVEHRFARERCLAVYKKIKE